uniref:Uncharacterized protein n=1 Tax=Vitis vinifera TaxID=29760 RepID=A5BDH8_VITVI|nr:hypothetical protein VITISV_001312 [Vitis vinifera]
MHHAQPESGVEHRAFDRHSLEPSPNLLHCHEHEHYQIPKGHVLLGGAPRYNHKITITVTLYEMDVVVRERNRWMNVKGAWCRRWMIKFSQCTIEGSLHAVTDPSPRSFFDTDSSWATWFNHPFIQLAIPSMPRRNATTSCPIPKKNDVACGAKCGMKMKNVTMILTNIQNDRRKLVIPRGLPGAELLLKVIEAMSRIFSNRTPSILNSPILISFEFRGLGML